MRIIRAAVVGTSMLASGAAQAATTIDVALFDPSAYNSIVAGLSVGGGEDFETFSVGNVGGPGDPQMTSVGAFETLGGKGSGGTIGDASFANDGTKLAIREGNVYGRTSTTDEIAGLPEDRTGKFLDSNDTIGIKWDVALAGGSMFSTILFTLTDATDVGAIMDITVGGVTRAISGLGNGQSIMVLIELDTLVSSTVVTLRDRFADDDPFLNDGFSVDDVVVGVIPLPASALLLLGGLGGLGALGRRKRG